MLDLRFCKENDCTIESHCENIFNLNNHGDSFTHYHDPEEEIFLSFCNHHYGYNYIELEYKVPLFKNHTFANDTF